MNRLLRLPLAMLMRFVMSRPQLKAKVRVTIARSPMLTKLIRRLTRQSSYQPPARVKRQAPGAMTPRSQRIFHHLKKAQQGRLD
jgi:hypothetical protein